MVEQFKTINKKLLFNEKLREATIISRDNRFIFQVELNGKIVKTHSPTTGGVGGNFKAVNGRKCLISGPYDLSKRTTEYTVEAIKLPSSSGKDQWVGINQTQVNRWIETALENNWLNTIPSLSVIETVKREQSLGSSRLDFLVNENVFVEVKMPLKGLQIPGFELPAKGSSGLGVSRMVKQLGDIESALKNGQKALLFAVFAYDNPGFAPPAPKTSMDNSTFNAIQSAKGNGLESWQINFKFEPDGVTLKSVSSLFI